MTFSSSSPTTAPNLRHWTLESFRHKTQREVSRRIGTRTIWRPPGTYLDSLWMSRQHQPISGVHLISLWMRRQLHPTSCRRLHVARDPHHSSSGMSRCCDIQTWCWSSVRRPGLEFMFLGCFETLLFAYSFNTSFLHFFFIIELTFIVVSSLFHLRTLFSHIPRIT